MASDNKSVIFDKQVGRASLPIVSNGHGLPFLDVTINSSDAPMRLTIPISLRISIWRNSDRKIIEVAGAHYVIGIACLHKQIFS